MRRILLAILLFVSVASHAAEQIIATLSVTNAAGTTNGNTIVINGNGRTWTNTVTSSPSTLIQVTNSPSLVTTQLLTHLGTYSAGSALSIAYGSSTSLVFRGSVGGALVITVAGGASGWATVSYSTNVFTNTFIVRVPFETETATNRTNIASLLVRGLNSSTNAFPTNAVALTNYVTIGHVAQTLGNKTLTNGISDGMRLTNVIGFNGTFLRGTNGYFTNSILDRPITTNLVNQGNAISSVGSGPFSEQLGTGAVASGTNSLAVGKTALATKTSATAIGNSATASGDYGTALGYGAISSGFSSIGIGALANSAGSNSVAIGAGADATTYADAIVLGTGALASDTNQVTLGGSTYTVRIPGRIIANSQTNSTFTGTNQWLGSIQHPRAATGAIRTGLANTNNYLDAATNAELYVTGATTLHNFTGMKGGQDGQRVRIRDGCGTDVEIFNLDGSVTAADRFWTGTGSKITLTNKPVYFEVEYNSQSNWWEVVTFR